MESSQAMRMVWKRSVDGDTLILVSLVIVSGALIWATLTTGQDWGGDFAQYIMQARSIVEGNPADSLQQNRLAVEQSTRPMGPLAYPWGTPLLLAPLYAVFGLNMVGLKILNVVCYLTWILLIWLGWRRYHPRLLGFVLVMLFAFNPTLVYSTNSLLSDIPFTLFSTAGILLIGAVVAEKRTFLSPAADYALLGLLLAFCFFVRTNGLLLVFTLFLAQMITGLSAFKRGNGWVAPSEFVTRSILRLRRSDKGGGAGWILPYISFAVAVLIWNRFFPEGGASHLGHLGRLDLAWVTGNVVYYATVGAGFFRGFPLHLLLYSATIPLLIIGILGRFRNDYPMIIYGLLTLVV